MKKRTISVLISFAIMAAIVFTMTTQKNKIPTPAADRATPVEEHREVIVPIKVEISQIKDDLEKKKEKLGGEEKILEKGLGLLENSSDTKINVGGRAFFRETLVLGLSARLQICKTLRKEIKEKEQLLSKLQATLNAEFCQFGLDRDEETFLKSLRIYFQENNPTKSRE